MRRIAWVTDLHLNYVSPQQTSAFLDSLNQLPVDLLLLGGDISESSRLLLDLSEIAARIRKPVYFVLGSSDYYRSSIATVRQQVDQLSGRMPNMTYLSTAPVVELSPQTALVGHDGWGDGVFGNVEESAQLNEELQIEELTTYDRHSLMAKLHDLGAEAAAHMSVVLEEALSKYKNVCLLTHVPPFRESCWHEGAIAAEEFLPRFTCGAMAKVIQEQMAKHPDRQMTVLCGHTHSSGVAQILPNTVVWTGEAQYCQPQVQRLFWVP
jgi:Icc protein